MNLMQIEHIPLKKDKTNTKQFIAALQQYNTIKNEEISLFEIPSVKHSSRWGSSWNKYIKPYEPSFIFPYYALNSGKYTIEILTEDETKLMSFSVNAVKGYNYFEYDVSVSEERVNNYFFKNDISVKQAKNEKYYLPKGKYIVRISNKTNSSEQEFIVK